MEETKKEQKKNQNIVAKECVNDDNRNCFREAIDKFLELMNSQIDAFPILLNTLAVNVKTCGGHFKKFIEDRKVKVEKDESSNEIVYTVNMESGKEFERVQNELLCALNAFSLIPRNTVVAMVSLYDAFLADLLECAYKVKPELLNACEKEFSYSEIVQFESIDNLKKHIIEKEVESIIRESHIKQFEILSKKFNVELAKDLDSYNDFIEITERRNLFVHKNGKVSSQYLKTCKGRPIDHNDEDIQIGEELDASPMYVEHCYKTLFEIGVKLGQVIWRKLENDLEKADDSLIDIGYTLIKNRKYQLACIITDFSCKPYVKHFNNENEYILQVNRALSYYLNGDIDKCKEIIDVIDWSGTELKFQMAYKVLLEQFDDAIIIMKSIGKTDKMRSAYADWPLFNSFRNTQQFKNTYKEIYGCDYQFTETQPTKWEDIIQDAFELIKEIKDKKSKNDNA